MSDETETYGTPSAGFPSPWIYRPEIFLRAVTDLLARVEEGTEDSDLQYEAAKIRDLIPPVDFQHMLMVELPEPDDTEGRCDTWVLGDMSVHADDSTNHSAEVEIKGRIYRVDNPRGMAAALLAADAA